MTLTLDPQEKKRIETQKQKLLSFEAQLRSIQGLISSRSQLQLPDAPQLLSQLETLRAEHLRVLSQDFQSFSDDRLKETEERLRQQALSYFQKSKVDPQLWKDLASSS